MTEDEILEKLREIVSGIMNISPEAIKSNSKQGDIPEWDSLGHLILIMTIEENFSVKFSITEIPNFKSIDAFITEIKKQIKQ